MSGGLEDIFEEGKAENVRLGEFSERLREQIDRANQLLRAWGSLENHRAYPEVTAEYIDAIMDVGSLLNAEPWSRKVAEMPRETPERKVALAILDTAQRGVRDAVRDLLTKCRASGALGLDAEGLVRQGLLAEVMGAPQPQHVGDSPGEAEGAQEEREEPERLEEEKEDRKAGKATRGHHRVSVNARMLARIQSNEDCVSWSQRDWAGWLGCTPGAIQKAQAWQAILRLRQAEQRSRRGRGQEDDDA